MALIHRLRNVFRNDALTREIEEEIAFHIAERVDSLVEAGVPRQRARREALRAFGSLANQKERTRDMNVTAWLDSAWADLRQAGRQMRRAPGFTAVAILSLALGAGANSAIFQLVDGIRLQSLPVRDPARLAFVDSQGDFYSRGTYNARNRAFTYALYEQIQARQRAFESIMAMGNTRFNLSLAGEARYADGLYLSANFAEVLGVAPFIGSGFAADGDRIGCKTPGVLLDYAFWQREYGGAANVTSREIRLDSRAFPILGVMPRAFYGLEPGRRFDVAAPLCISAILSEDGNGRMASPTWWWLGLVGRLAPGWTPQRAAAHFGEMSPGLFAETVPPEYRPDSAQRYRKNRLTVVSGEGGLPSIRKSYESPLWMLLALTALVLLIACANLANLLLARASVRAREFAVRTAIGASRLRLARQLITESLALATAGSVAGAAIGHVLSRSLVSFLDDGDSRLALPPGLNWHVFAFTAGTAVIACVLFGLAPAIQAARRPPAGAMLGGRGTAAAGDRNRLRRGLVASQIALCLVLLVGALLFTRSLGRLLSTGTGIKTEGVLVASLFVSAPKLDAPQRQAAFERVQQRVRALPGVTGVAGTLFTPFSQSGWNDHVQPERGKTAEPVLSFFNAVTPGYFATMGTRLVAGREFTEADMAGVQRIAIVNREFSKKLFGGGNPVGRSFRVEGPAGRPPTIYEVAGMVENTKYNNLREDFKAIAFLPVTQLDDFPDRLDFLVRSNLPLSGTINGIRAVLEGEGALQAEFQILDIQVARSVLRERLMANLSGAFGILAALLATLGLYGVMSYTVARRRNEIGVRMALGARRGDISRLVLGESARLVMGGIAIGLAGAVALSRYVKSILYQLEPDDPVTLALAVGLLAVTAAVAAWFPARRAARVDPAVVLRDD
ncbi:MAG: ABC transporter permease [Bryobacteraceae bacterium]